jgi:hypothetical protein
VVLPAGSTCGSRCSGIFVSFSLLSGSSGWSHVCPGVPECCIIILHQRLPCDGRSCDFRGHLIYSVSVPMFFRLVLMSRRVKIIYSAGVFCHLRSCRVIRLLIDQSLLLMAPAGPEVVLHCCCRHSAIGILPGVSLFP